MLKKFADYRVNEYNSNTTPTSNSNMLQPDSNMDATMADASMDNKAMGDSTSDFDTDSEVTGSPTAKTVASEIHVTIDELQDMMYDAHTRIKNQKQGDNKPLLVITSDEGHEVKIMLEF